MAVKRVEWQCPDCGKRFAIPADVEHPEVCPQCRQARAPRPVAEAPQPTLDPMSPAPATDAVPVPTFDTPERTAPPTRGGGRRKYPALRMIALTYRLMAALGVIGSLVGIGIALRSATAVPPSDERTAAILTGLSIFGGAVFATISLLAVAELIHVAIDIEENTRHRE